jgi:beta-glucosidase
MSCRPAGGTQTFIREDDVVVEPYRVQSNTVEARVEDLLSRLTRADKTGLMFHDIVAMGPGGSLMRADNPFGRLDTQVAITKQPLTGRPPVSRPGLSEVNS